jgi:hypothetical protein
MSATSPRNHRPERAPHAELAPRPRRPRRRRNWDLVLVPLAALLAMTTLVAPPAQAQPTQGGASAPHVGGSTNCNGNATCDLDATLTNVQYFLIGIAVLLAGVAFAIYGIQYMLGSLEEMDPSKKAQKKNQAIAIVVGLVTVLLSVVLVSVAKGLIVTS